jgi:hypothetical protein
VREGERYTGGGMGDAEWEAEADVEAEWAEEAERADWAEA